MHRPTNRPGRPVHRTVAARLLAAVAGVLLLVPGASPAAAETPIIWGGHPELRNGDSKAQSLTRLERVAGRRLSAVRQFYLWDTPWPTSFETGLKDTGRTLVISVKSKRMNGTLVPWSSIANAQPGTTRYNEIVSWARRVRDYDRPIWVTFNHEPEASASNGMGTDAEYIAAWRRWVTIFREQGATNARFMWIMTDRSFEYPSTDRRQAQKWYPGDAWVEAIAADAYNWFNCRVGISNPWKTLQRIIEPQRAFWGSHRGEQLWLAEYATADDRADPQRKARWYAEAQALFKTARFSAFDGVMLFEPSPGNPSCNWRPDVHIDAAGTRTQNPAASQAWRAFGLDAFYG